MPLVPMRQILDEAAKGGYGVGAFNVNNMEQIQAIMEACKKTQSPVIIQASRGALQYSNLAYLQKLMEAAVIDNPEIPVVMHLDHGNSLETCKTAIGLVLASGWLLAASADTHALAFAVTLGSAALVAFTRRNPLIAIAGGAAAFVVAGRLGIL